MAAKSDGDFQEWLDDVMQYYANLSDDERNQTIDTLIACSGSSQLSYLQTKACSLLYRDFLKLLPLELKEHVLAYLDGNSLLACCCVSKTWSAIISSSSIVWQRACQNSGFIVNKNIDNVDAKYWKSFYLEMTRRLHYMKNYKSFASKTYNKNLRRISAVYYYKGKVATASDSKIIQIWDCGKDTCLVTVRTDSSIASIKFDDSILVASSYLGHMVAWDSTTGQRLTEYMRHLNAVFTFDYSKELNIIISGSADSLIKIWALSNGYLFKTLSEHTGWVLKVMLCPYPLEKESKSKNRHLLLSMDKTVIVVRLLNFVSSDSSLEGLYITTLYSIKHSHSDDSHIATGLHFDGEFLYFPKQSSNKNLKSALLCKWDIKQRRMISELDLQMKVKTLLGVGKKYFVVLAPWQHMKVPNFVVMDKESLETVAFWNMPPSKPLGQGCSQSCLGEKDWLDGLDGKNDEGVLFTTAVDENRVLILKWIPRSEKGVT